jgi:chromosome segregation ATPase
MRLCTLHDIDLNWLITGTSQGTTLKIEMKGMETIITTLKRALDIKDAENKALQQRNLEKEQENLNLIGEIEASKAQESEIDTLKSRIEELEASKKTRRRRMKSTVEPISPDIPENNVEERDAQAKIMMLEKSLQDLEQKYNRITRENARLNKENTRLNELLRELRSEAKKPTENPTKIKFMPGSSPLNLELDDVRPPRREEDIAQIEVRSYESVS